MAFDKVIDSAQLNADLESVADAIRDKGNTTEKLMFPAGMVSAIGDIKTKESVTWNQCPPLVKAFLDEVTYDPADYSNSQIASYAPATADVSNTKPVGKTIGGKTFYNEEPNNETPFSTETTAGTLKPLDHLRWLNTATMNVRDLGGWTCDGGTVKYGMLFRGGEPNAADKALMVEDIGIRHELQLRGSSEAPQQYSIWGIDFTCPETFVWMSLSNKPAWKQILRCVFDTIPFNLPLYFHCAAGADRTATVAVMLEALLGMNQSDIDKDYELTCFSTGTGTDAQARRRDEDEYKAYIAEIKAVPLPSGVEDTFRNHAMYFVASLGFTADEINAFRSAMIDGTPEVISLNLESYGITNDLSHVENSNADTTASEYQPYNAELKAPNGYVIDSVQVKMGGVDITSDVFRGTKTNLYYAINKNLTGCSFDGKDAVIAGQDFVAKLTADSGYTLDGATITITMGGIDMSSYYSDGKIAIPNVTGNIEITATAVQSVSPIFDIEWNVKHKCSYKAGDSFELVADNAYTTSSLLPIQAGSSYKLSWKQFSSTTTFHVVWVSSDGIILKDEGSTLMNDKSEITFTAPSGASHCAIRVNTGNVTAREEQLINYTTFEAIS